MVKVMRMGVGALAFAAMDAFGHEAMEYVQDEQARVTKVRLIIFWGIFLIWKSPFWGFPCESPHFSIQNPKFFPVYSLGIDRGRLIPPT